MTMPPHSPSPVNEPYARRTITERRPEVVVDVEVPHLDAHLRQRTVGRGLVEARDLDAGRPVGADAAELHARAAHVDDAGTRGVYLFDGDVYVLDFAGARFVRVTATPEPETLPRFSPDGTKLAYVRASDLYVYDLAADEEHRRTADGSDTILNGKLSYVYEEEIFDREDRIVELLESGDSPALRALRPRGRPRGGSRAIAPTRICSHRRGRLRLPVEVRARTTALVPTRGGGRRNVMGALPGIASPSTSSQLRVPTSNDPLFLL